jgi:hypothetical protein
VAQGPIASLEDLLRALAKERSLRGRLRVLGHSWKLLRALSPHEREQVALRLGSKWAWKRVEKAFLKDGDLSESEQLVGRAFERMGDSDPAELRKMARMIREGDRAGAQDLLMITLTEALEEEAQEEEALSEEERAAKQLARDAAAGQDALREAEVEETLAEDLLEEEVDDEPTFVSGVVDRAEDVLASTLARPVEEPAPRPAPKPQPVAPRAVPAPVRIETKPIPPTPPTPEPSIALAADGSGGDRLRVLRALQRSPQAGSDLGRAGRAALLESLGGGWASRRALSRMIGTHSLDGVDEAIGLIRTLVRPSQQAWCLGDLIAHWELDPGDLDRILEAAPTDAARRRLSHRCAESTRTR